MRIDDLNIEFKKLESPESVDSAQTATRISHNDWLDTKSVGASVQRSLSELFSSKEKLESEKRLKTGKAWEKYYKQGEPGKSDHHTQTDLIQVYQIWNIVGYYISSGKVRNYSSTQSRTKFRLSPCSSSES